VAFLFSETSETKGRLTTTTVFLRKIDGELVNYITSVTAQCPEKSTITIHDNEAELLVGF
jgi:hypothetical protein